MRRNLKLLKNKELVNMILGRDGGKTTIKIIDEILEQPQNANQLAKRLDVNYNTITHHINIIDEYNYVEKSKFKKQYFYYPSDKLLNSINEYTTIKKYINKKNKE